MYKVKIENERPDFRVFIDLLYGQNKNIDSDGDSNPVYSRNWTELYVKKRDNISSSIEIFANCEKPEFFEVNSDDDELEEIVALYLYEYCGNSIEKNSQILSLEVIDNLKNKFRINLQRARESIWHESDKNNPYPNLTI